MENDIYTRICRVCNTKKELNDYALHSKNPDKYKNICKICNKIKQKEYYKANKQELLEQKKEYYKINKDLIINSNKEFYQKNKDLINKKHRVRYAANKKKSADRNKKYYELNKESIIIRNFLYVEKNKDLVLERRRNYQKNNFIRIKENGSRRRARERNAKTFYITDKDLRRLKNSPCYLCGEKASHIDHIIPLSRGGTHGIGNLAAMCAYENMSKGNLFLVDFKHRRLPRMMKLRNLALV